MARQFMREHKGERSVREMDMSFRGANRRVLQMGEAEAAAKTERGGRRAARPHPGDCAAAPLSTRESAGAGSAAERLRETGQPEKSGPVDARLRGKLIPAANSNRGLEACENLLSREPLAETAEAKWVSDLTYLRVLDGRLCLTVLLPVWPESHWLGIQRRPGGGPRGRPRPARGLCQQQDAGVPALSFRPGGAASLNQVSRRFERPPPNGSPEREMRRGAVGSTPAQNHFSKP
jgi:hypothetical protein